VGAGDRYAYVGNNPTNSTDPSGHVRCDADGFCGDQANVGKKPDTWKTDPDYDPDTNTIPDWDNVDRGTRATTIWNWLCKSGGWWGDGCPHLDDLMAWLLMKEGGTYPPEAIAIIARAIPYILSGKGEKNPIMIAKGISLEGLKYFTSFINPNRGGAFDADDWNQLTTRIPEDKYYTYMEKAKGLGPEKDASGALILDWADTDEFIKNNKPLPEEGHYYKKFQFGTNWVYFTNYNIP